MSTTALENVLMGEEVPTQNTNDGCRPFQADRTPEVESSISVNNSRPHEKEHDHPSISERRPVQQLARKVNFEGFKNRFSEEDGRCPIEVLVAGGNLNHEIRREILKRAEYKQNSAKGKYRGKPWKTASIMKTSTGTAEGALHPEDRGWIQRVRIQSQPVLKHLARVVGESWPPDKPRTFYRPFSVLIYFQSKMKEALVELERKWTEDGNRGVENEDLGTLHQENTGTNRDETKSTTEEDVGDDRAEAIASSVEALRDMRCYVKFVDDDIAPLYRQFDGTARTKIRFDDLWLLFRVGESVFASEASAPVMPSSKPKPTTMYQQLWRIYTLNTPIPQFEYPNLNAEFKPSRFSDNTDEDCDDSGVPIRDFKVWAYYIDHDGDSYGAVKHAFIIQRYEGEKDIVTLPCFPIRFMKECENHLQELKKQGNRFQMCIEKKHLEYNGWTLVTNPDGKILSTKMDNTGKQRPLLSEYIDSHIIVDFAEACHEVSDRKPAFHYPSVYSDDWSEAIDGLPIQRWANKERTEVLSQWDNEIVQTMDGVEMWQRREGLEKDTFLKTYSKRQHGQEDGTELELTDEDIMLLPRRLFAYVLRDRKFVAVDLRYLEPVQEQKDVFNNLKIESEYKNIVKGLVASHFMKKGLEKEFFHSLKPSRSQDIIQGKGRGLVILLHGVPGVGKTATAEAVALEYQKPLFVITCGDLGLTPREVEESLTEIFRLAHLWDCILLLDEADVFLTQRSRLDLKRNALVSVFLRILEYYNGILFLTTNRVGMLDEAFKSRIHMSLYYPPLNETQVKLIFTMNITRLIDIEKERSDLTNKPRMEIRGDEIEKFAEAHCRKTQNAGGRWNGRQIRNAFEIASSLARYDSLFKDTTQPATVLDGSQFAKVERATVAFDQYMKDTKGYNDADYAYINGERSDFAQTRKFGAGPSPHPPPSQFGAVEASDDSQYRGMQLPSAQPGPVSFGTNASISGSPQYGIGPGATRSVYNTPTPRRTFQPGSSQASPGQDPFAVSGGHGYNHQTSQGYTGNSTMMGHSGYQQNTIDASLYD